MAEKIGSGRRFRGLKAKLAGARNPGALAAAIGRQKFGNRRFAALAAAGRRRDQDQAEIDGLPPDSAAPGARNRTKV